MRAIFAAISRVQLQDALVTYGRIGGRKRGSAAPVMPPFGDELTSGYSGRTSLWGASDQVRQKFTGAEQDNQDVSFFQARYYMPARGKFNSPDPMNFGADLVNPGSWNGYSYVTNSPLSNVDPSGLGGVVFNFGGAQSGSNGQGGGFTFFGWCFSGCESGSSGSGKSQPKKPGQQATTSGFVQQASQVGNNALTSVGNAIGKASDFLNTAPGVSLITGMAILAQTGGGEETPAVAEAIEDLQAAVSNESNLIARLIRKPVNLPSFDKLAIDWNHIAERHMPEGLFTDGRDVFLNLNRQGVLAAMRQAYSASTVIAVQGDRVLLEGVTKTGMTVQMWLNKAENLVETSYPVGKQ